jgi:hypothetical protein
MDERDGAGNERGIRKSPRSRSRSQSRATLTWTVDVGVMARVGFVFNMCRVDGDTTRLLFWCLVDLIVSQKLDFAIGFVSEHLGDGCRQGGLAVVDMSCGQDTGERAQCATEGPAAHGEREGRRNTRRNQHVHRGTRGKVESAGHTHAVQCGTRDAHG